jgi:hypothetical protein
LGSTLSEFERHKTYADKALGQLSEGDWFFVPDQESNSIALIVKHVAGNLGSRWKDFFTSDGEKPDRDRDAEFVLEASDTVESLKARWEGAWGILYGVLGNLGPADLSRTITIRSEPVLAVAAIQRSLAHTASHVGQIVYIAKHLRGPEFGSLSVPRGQSRAFLEAMQKRR